MTRGGIAVFIDAGRGGRIIVYVVGVPYVY
jgi:hypothetical protein